MLFSRAGQFGRQRQARRISLSFAIGLAFAVPASAGSLSANPYILTPFHQPPAPGFSPSLPPYRAEGRSPYNPPPAKYRPRPAARPGRAAEHELWCSENHPSYRPADNSYRPFDRSPSMPPQARRPCVSPYSG